MTNTGKQWRVHIFWKHPRTGRWMNRDLGGLGEALGQHRRRIVLAVSINQAMFMAANDKWANPCVSGRTVGVLFDAVAVPPESTSFEWHGRARCGHVLSDAAVLRLTDRMEYGLPNIRAALAAVCGHESTCRVSPSSRS